MPTQMRAGQWLLEDRLGSGGMAEVYRGRSPSGQVAAIKLLRAEVAEDETVLARFQREAKIASELGHPGIVPVFATGIADDGRPFLAMELLHGKTLAQLGRTPGGIPLAALLRYIDALLDVLTAAHAQGVVHRDLKPANLFVTDAGELKVLDFGVARLHEIGSGDLRTATGIALGTVTYMAPEQALGKRDEVDARTDLFAVGAICFRLLSGRRLHEASGEAELLLKAASEAAPPLRSVAPEVPASVASVIDRALAFDKQLRYANAQEMRAALRAAGGDSGRTASGAPDAHATVLETLPGQSTTVETVVVSPSPDPTLPATAPALGPAFSPKSTGSSRPQGGWWVWGISLAVLVLLTGGLVLILGFGGLYQLMRLSDDKGASPPPNGGKSVGSREEAYTKVDLSVLATGFARGDSAVIERYRHIPVQTSGAVVGLGESAFKRRLLFDGVKLGKDPWLFCVLDSNPAVAIGSTVTVRGRITSWMPSERTLLVSPCEIVP